MYTVNDFDSFPARYPRFYPFVKFIAAAASVLSWVLSTARILVTSCDPRGRGFGKDTSNRYNLGLTTNKPFQEYGKKLTQRLRPSSLAPHC